MEKKSPGKDDWELRDEVLKGKGARVLPVVRRTLCLPPESSEHPTDSPESTVSVPLAPPPPRELPPGHSAR